MEPFTLLFLPYLETRVRRMPHLPLPDAVPLFDRLATARLREDRRWDLARSLPDTEFSPEARDFLLSWANCDFDLLCPP